MKISGIFSSPKLRVFTREGHRSAEVTGQKCLDMKLGLNGQRDSASERFLSAIDLPAIEHVLDEFNCIL